ncbi:ankyrin repeat domain-containing protein 62-like isoform X2 [Trichogramma pretiosum]|uniref:ankyrin repeat domain-containing protein 62-like isoform X2 n=1 Tax=Trichogramma pretiosum TaxID=7493 RepID=UPI000C71C655|nr:ankyrin repeat domain-containing protein 62-like isoform X2 [Trichogramma pretiosum]
MLTTFSEEYVSVMRKMFRDYVMRHDDAKKRREMFCCLCHYNSQLCLRPITQGPCEKRILIELMNCKELFPSVEDKKYFLKYALDKPSLEMIKLLEEGNLKIHEVKLEDGQSALHYLAEIMDYFLESPEKNYQDNLGYTYLHGACMSGNVSAVNLLLSQGVDVNLDTYTCSPLHIAAQYRHADVVEILLTHGANPNQRDAEKSTPLHALARLCLCQCTDCEKFCDERKPVDKLVQMLIDHGADIEAQNCHGYTPLGLSVCRFDLELTRTLLKHGAKIDNLNENKIFNMTFTPLELKNYPLTLNIIEMAHLLKSAGYNLSLQARLRMMKYWLKIRGNDTDHLIGEHSCEQYVLINIEHKIDIHRIYGLYITQEAEDFLHQKCKELRNVCPSDYHRFYPQEAIDDLEAQVERTKNIMLSENVSLYQICQMSYSKGYSLIKGMKNWRLPAMDDISCTYVNIIAKRHLANVLIRTHLERLVADFFMTDHCNLNLPYLACLKIAEHMSDEDLFRLCRQTGENHL